MIIRPKIREIGENVDKFKTRSYGTSGTYTFNLISEIDTMEIRLYKYFLYRNVSICYNLRSLHSLNKKEKRFLYKIFHKKAKKDVKIEKERKLKIENNLLNSIIFK